MFIVPIPIKTPLKCRTELGQEGIKFLQCHSLFDKTFYEINSDVQWLTPLEIKQTNEASINAPTGRSYPAGTPITL